MYKEINIEETKRANLFLRSLWAKIRKTYPEFGWQYSPFKVGPKQRIYFGQMGLGHKDGSILVSISYEKRGSIKGIYFDYFDHDLSEKSDIGKILAEATQDALLYQNDLKSYAYKITVESQLGPISPYIGKHFNIDPLTKSKFYLSLSVNAYDDVDAKSEFRKKILPVLDILSIQTNLPFWVSNEISNIKSVKENIPEQFTSEIDWIDDYSYENGYVVISKKCKEFIDKILDIRSDNSDYIKFLRASRLFHTARKYEYQLFNSNSKLFSLGDATVELIPVLYMTTMEVVSLIIAEESKSCVACGQPMYKISERVGNYAEIMSSSSNFKSMFKQYYSNRSKYLHLGLQMTTQSYTGISLPQLNNDDPSGCEAQSLMPNINLREFVSYLLRKQLQKLV